MVAASMSGSTSAAMRFSSPIDSTFSSQRSRSLILCASTFTFACIARLHIHHTPAMRSAALSSLSISTARTSTRLLSLQAGKRRRRQDHVGNRLHDRPIAVALRSRLQPFRVLHERAPPLLAFRQIVPLEHVVKVAVTVANGNRPEADLPDAVLFPQVQRHPLEALVEIGQPARRASIDTQFVDHRGPRESSTERVSQGGLQALAQEAQKLRREPPGEAVRLLDRVVHPE